MEGGFDRVRPPGTLGGDALWRNQGQRRFRTLSKPIRSSGTASGTSSSNLASARTRVETSAIVSTLSQPLVKHVQRLNQIRRAIPALRKGQYSTEGVSGQIAYKRRFTDGSVDSFVLVAVSGNATFTGIPNGTYVDAVTGDSKAVTGGTLSINLSGKGNMRAYVLSLSGNPAPGKIGTDGPYLK